MTSPQERQRWWSNAIKLDSYLKALAEDAATRTVVGQRDLPRVRQWIDEAVRHAVNEAAQALHSIRYWCDTTEQKTRPYLESDDPTTVGWAESRLKSVAEVRALLPAFEAFDRRAETGGEVISDGNACDVPRRRGRPGLEVDPSP